MLPGIIKDNDSDVPIPIIRLPHPRDSTASLFIISTEGMYEVQGAAGSGKSLRSWFAVNEAEGGADPFVSHQRCRGLREPLVR